VLRTTKGHSRGHDHFASAKWLGKSEVEDPLRWPGWMARSDGPSHQATQCPAKAGCRPAEQGGAPLFKAKGREGPVGPLGI
jgi:hypothetical protein